MKHKLLNKLWLRVGMIVAIMTTALAGTVKADTVTIPMNQQGWADASAIGSGILKDDTGTNTSFNFSSAQGEASNAPAYYNSGTNVRFYSKKNGTGNGGSMTITPAANTGITITGIVLTASSGYTPTTKYNVDGGSDVSLTWDGTTGTVSGISATTSFKFRNANAANNTNQLRITQIEITYTVSAPSYTIAAQSNNSSYGTVSLIGNVITGSPNSGYRYASPAYSVSPANSATVAQNGNEFTVTPSANTTVTINFEAIPTYTVTLGDDNSTLTETIGGAGVTLPSRDAIDSYTFAGWSTANVATETTTAPTTIIPAGTYNPTGNITLYPVYTKTVAGGGTTHETASVTISEYATAHSWGSSSSTGQKSITLNSDVTATCNDGTNSGKYYSDWRIYQTETGKVTITTTSGELTSVTFTFTNSNSGTLNYNSSALTSGTAVDVSGTSAEFLLGNSGTATNGQIRITAISVNYDVTGGSTTYYWSAPVAAAVETPVIAVADNPFLFSTTATITCATDGATIKYSYDGENWSDYSSALTINETKTIYAKAIKGGDESTVASVTATKNLATPTVTVSGDLTLDLDGGTNVSAGTLTAAVTYENAAVAGATVTWSSSNTDIATIGASGAVTIKTTGEVTFTATYAANSDYAEATGTKTVTVVDNKAPGSVGNPYTVAQALEVINALADGGITDSEVYTIGIISQIDEVSTSYGNATYYISADGTTTDQLEVFRGKYLENANFTDENQIKVGDNVLIYGKLQKYVNNSVTTPEIAQGNYIYSLSREKIDPTILVENSNVAYGSTFTVDDDLIEGGDITVTSSNTAVATVSGLVITPVAVGTTTITVATAESTSYNAGSETFELTVTQPAGSTTAPTGSAGGTIFEETFDGCEGTGGNDDNWSGSIASNNLNADNDGWTFSHGSGADQCAKFGSTSAQGSATTPALGTAGTLTLSFKAGAWNGGSEGTTLNLSVSEGSISPTSVTLTKGEFNTYTATITDATTATQITFAAKNSSNNRFFLDDVKVVAPASPAPEITVTLNTSGYATYCSQYPLDFSDYATADYSAWQITGVSGETITFSQITGSVKGGTGILLKGPATDPRTTITLTSADSDNELDDNLLYGTLAPTYAETDQYYGLSGNQFVKVNAGTVPAGKALLPASALTSGGSTVKAFTFVFEEDDATGISLMEDGRSKMEDGSIYNLAGQMVNGKSVNGKLPKGIYIVNGKKILK